MATWVNIYTPEWDLHLVQTVMLLPAAHYALGSVGEHKKVDIHEQDSLL